MSITVRLWNDADLEATKTDKWLATLLMNGNTFSDKMLGYYPSERRVYICEWDDSPEPITVYATDVRMLKRFLEAEYTRLPDWISQKITQYRPVNL